jgi:hypothetical protein
MYTASDFGIYYSYLDLPNTISVIAGWAGFVNVIFTRTTTGYIGPFGSIIEIQNGIWVLSSGEETNGLNDINPTCLIAQLDDFGNSAHDQFASSYIITSFVENHLEPVVVTRQSLCQWIGLDSCGGLVALNYQPNVQTDLPYGPRWAIGFQNYVSGCEELDSSSGTKFSYANGGDGINTPVGNYYEFHDKPPIGSVS